MKCKYSDCGWCYAPESANTNDEQGQCTQPLSCKERDAQVIEAKDITEEVA